MEKIANKIQSVIALVGQRNYDKALDKMYPSAGCNAHQLIEKLMTEGWDFYRSCRRYEDLVEAEVLRIDKVKKSPRFRKFVEDYKDWSSGYAMGEEIIVQIHGNYTGEDICVADRTQYYSGRGRKYNKSVTHGYAVMTVDITGVKNSYKVDVLKK